jgi:hypothetical protein
MHVAVQLLRHTGKQIRNTFKIWGWGNVVIATDRKDQLARWREKLKVKCTLVQALRLCTGRAAHRGSRGIALLYRH